MTRSELVGYVRKDSSGNGLKLRILKSAMDTTKTVQGKDKTEYIELILNLEKVKKILAGEQELTSVCQLIDE